MSAKNGYDMVISQDIVVDPILERGLWNMMLEKSNILEIGLLGIELLAYLGQNTTEALKAFYRHFYQLDTFQARVYDVKNIDQASFRFKGRFLPSQLDEFWDAFNKSYFPQLKIHFKQQRSEYQLGYDFYTLTPSGKFLLDNFLKQNPQVNTFYQYLILSLENIFKNIDDLDNEYFFSYQFQSALLPLIHNRSAVTTSQMWYLFQQLLLESGLGRYNSLMIPLGKDSPFRVSQHLRILSEQTLNSGKLQLHLKNLRALKLATPP